MRAGTLAAVGAFLIGCVAGCGQGSPQSAPTATVQTPEIQQPQMSKTIDQCLSGERPDLAVSLWLQDKAAKTGVSSLPKEVAAAYRADRFLVEINSGGFLGFFDWEQQAAPMTVEDLKAMALADDSKALAAAMQMVVRGPWPKSEEEFKQAETKFMDDKSGMDLMDKLDQAVIARNAQIESATHDYIRHHIAVFEKLDR